MTHRIRIRRAIPLLLAVALLAASTLGAEAAKSRAHSSRNSGKSSTSTTSSSAAAGASTEGDFAGGKALLHSQDTYDLARERFRAKRPEEAITLLDGAILELNDAITKTPDRRIRSAIGDLLRRCGSLRLAATQAREAQVAASAAAARSALAAAGSSTAPAASVYGPTLPGLPGDTLRTPERTEPLIAATVAPAPEIPLPDEGGGEDPAWALPALDDDPNAIAIESHPLVDKWLDYFTGRGRPVFERWLERSGLYMGWMKGILEREGVPTDLVHLVFVESGFNPHARSYASAVGPWQFIRGTANLFGLTVNSWMDERKDPEASTVAAARYLKHLYGLFNSWPLALASYNAGEGAVLRAIERQGTKDFWSLRLPDETRNYVPKFMAVLTIARDPGRFGFDQVPQADPLAYDEVTLPGPVDLRGIAEACGTSVDEIRTLNPSFLRSAAIPPKGQDQVTIRVPDGVGERLLSGLEAGTVSLPTIETPAEPVVLRHKVRRGESLKSLSLRYGVPTREIARYNRLPRKARLRVGRTVLIPQSDAPVAAPARSAPAPPAAATQATTQATADASPPEAVVRTIKVKKGQTLAAIAQAHGTTVAALRELNGMSAGESLKAGQRLKVPSGS
jgi:membrane-bound lytic murein transglycosylase D